MVVILLSAIAAMRNYPIWIAGSWNRKFRAQALTRVPAPQARELTPLPTAIHQRGGESGLSFQCARNLSRKLRIKDKTAPEIWNAVLAS